MKLEELIVDLKVKKIVGDVNLPIEGISYDSRKIKPGFLFACIEGYKTDGHKFVESALANGAVAILAQREVAVPAGVTLIVTDDSRQAMSLIAATFYEYPARKLIMIGVTGTNGKTTTTHLIADILEKQGNRVGLIGTIKNKIGARELPVTNTTPESLDLQALLGDMVKSGMNYAVMEVSSHALQLDRVYGIEFDIALFTNITQDHLDFHNNMAEYMAAKTKLFTELNKYSIKKHDKYAIINIDDQHSQGLIEKTGTQIITYSAQKEADVMAQNIDIGPKGASFDLVSKWGKIRLNMKMTGLFSIYNALAAAAATLIEGINPEEIKTTLDEVKGVSGRFELVDQGQDFSVIVDYAHTPYSLENVLRTASEFVKGRLITLFGCGGDRDKTKRPLMGRISAEYSDYTILTSDNPRSEEPLDILKQIEEGVSNLVNKEKYTIVPDRRLAIKQAIKMAQVGDIVLIAGKGHETYQIIGDKVLPFDDREEARLVLKEKK